MLKRCKATASPSAQVKPMQLRKAPNCLHRQILKKHFLLKHNPPRSLPPFPLTLDSVSITARLLSDLLTASWLEPKFRNWQLMGDLSEEGNWLFSERLRSLPSSRGCA